MHAVPAVTAALVIYSKMLGGFFQQDEYIGYARYILLKNGSLNSLISYILAPTPTHYTPFGRLLQYFSFSMFKLEYLHHAILSLSLHLIVIFLVFKLLKQLFKNNKLAAFGSLIFTITASSHQGTTWVVANLGLHLATIFALVSTSMFFCFLKNNKQKFLLLSLASYIISLLFKEVAVTLPLLYLLLLYFQKAPKKLNKKSTSYKVLSTLSIYIVFRIIIFLLPTPQGLSTSTVLNSQRPSRILFNLASAPHKTLIQTIIPTQQLKLISETLTKELPEEITGEVNTPEFDQYVTKRTLELVSSISAFIILTAVLLTLFTKRKSPTSKLILFGLLWVITNSFVYSFSPERTGVISVIDSRNLYFPSIGTSILLIGLLQLFTQRKQKLMLVVVSLISMLNGYWLFQNISQYSQQGQSRKKILDQIIADYQNLPDKVVFFTESDKSFYGLPSTERILPFQSGLGQTLLAFYYQSEKFPPEFFQNRFLWDIREQGYKEFKNRGFGYFRDLNILSDTINKYSIPTDSIIAYRYDSFTNSVSDISKEIGGRIESLNSDKTIIPKASYQLSSKFSPNTTKLAADNNKDTFWDTNVPYSYPTQLNITLSDSKNLAEIVIDSYNNLDQNQVGYKIQLSNDNKNWKEVFYSKLYPPSQEGLANLYFSPQKAQYIRINQIGSHNHASWVIHEISLYETN